MKRLAAALVMFLATLSADASSLDAVESKLFTIRDFKLDSGVTLSEVTIAYETYGALAGDGRNAVLITQSLTSSHHAAGFYGEHGAAPGQKAGDIGWWDKIIGPGEAIDTDKLFVVSSNMLGSSYGSTNPASIDPKTGKPYGPDFPAITIADMVRAQKALIDHLGVKHLVAVAGPSYGGYEAFQWAVSYPDFMQGIAALFTAPYAISAPEATAKLMSDLTQDPNWNGGRYYDKGGVVAAMTKIRIAMLKSYGVEALLADRFPRPAARETAVASGARLWAQDFDANGLIVLLRATKAFDLRPQLGHIKARVLYALSLTDQIFPPGIGPDVTAALKAAGVDARYIEVDSDIGHMAFGYETEKWSPALGSFIGELMRHD
jgi:homoserine O-acetyltransferase/O-succinyltransferase